MILPATPPAVADPESRLRGADHDALRLWLRLFTCTTMVERRVDGMLKRAFGSSLPRFDLLAQLYRAEDGLRMGELSERILTTNGNVTWLVAALEREGLVRRRIATHDRRAVVVRLTAAGRRQFTTMARAHEARIIALLAGLSPTERQTMHSMLGTVKQHLRQLRDTP